MSSTLSIWLLIALAVAISALLVFPLLSDETRLALRSRLRGAAGVPVVAAAGFLLVATAGVIASNVGGSSQGAGSGGAGSLAEAHSGSNGDIVASLKDYTRSIGAEQPASAPAGGKLLPDVNTMIERLVARLETTPGDAKGWRMLGWSYFHTGRHKQAAAALARALELDPSSEELKLAYQTASAKAAEGDAGGEAAPSPVASAGKGADRPIDETHAAPAAAPQRGEYDAAIRAMVDGLAARLESAPRDVEGWTRLMRSRVVLGEREVAETALRKALDVFKGDAAAMGRIAAAATELGLKAE